MRKRDKRLHKMTFIFVRTSFNVKFIQTIMRKKFDLFEIHWSERVVFLVFSDNGLKNYQTGVGCLTVTDIDAVISFMGTSCFGLSKVFINVKLCAKFVFGLKLGWRIIMREISDVLINFQVDLSLLSGGKGYIVEICRALFFKI